MENLDEHSLSNDITNQQTISPTAKTFLTKASGWVKVVGILGIVGSGIGLLGGLFSLVAVPIVGILYLIIYGVGIYISTLLLKVANSIDRGKFNMDEFAKNFYMYWKFAVIFSLVIVGISLIAGIFIASSGMNLINSRF